MRQPCGIHDNETFLVFNKPGNKIIVKRSGLVTNAPPNSAKSLTDRVADLDRTRMCRDLRMRVASRIAIKLVHWQSRAEGEAIVDRPIKIHRTASSLVSVTNKFDRRRSDHRPATAIS